MKARVLILTKATAITLPLTLSLSLALAATASAATITVTDTGDTIAVDNKVTLREAITSANNNASVNADVAAQNPGAYGTDTINFAILPTGSVKTISPTSALPVISGPVIINGYTQNPATQNTLANSDNAILEIELNGMNAGAGTAMVGVPGLSFGTGSSGSTVAGLVINRFSGDGILVKNVGITIQGNFIGTNPAGTAKGPGNANTSFNFIAPMRAGVFIDTGSNNIIGGTSPAQRNIIAGNVLDNLHISGVGNLASGNIVQGNFIGVGADGISTFPNATFFWGVEVAGANASGTLIGGLNAAERNVIGGSEDGIELDDGTHDNFIQGNYIGVGADGATPVGNRTHGIALRDFDGSPGIIGNTIGGTITGAGNTIANNGSSGVAIFGDPNVTPQNNNNPILGNSIFHNGKGNGAAPGIDLVIGNSYPTTDGPTPNDFGDADAGPNNLQNYPVLSASFPPGGGTDLSYSLNSRNNHGTGKTYRLEIFLNDSASPSGYGEGQFLIGIKAVFLGANPGSYADFGQSSASGTFHFNFTAPGNYFSATATELATDVASAPLNTSEFSKAVPAFPTPTPGTPRLANISTRAVVQTGDNVLIGGFIALGVGPMRVIVIAVGPSLGIPGQLADPTMELHDSNGNLVDSNDNWMDSPNKQEFIDDGLAPSNPFESAIARTVNAPESYTAIVRGVNNGTGIAVVQVFAVQAGGASAATFP